MYVKTKELDPVGEEGGVGGALLDPPMVYQCREIPQCEKLHCNNLSVIQSIHSTKKIRTATGCTCFVYFLVYNSD